MVIRRVDSRVGRESGQSHELDQVQLFHVLAEKRLGRGLDAVGAMAIVDLVQVQLENLILGEGALDLHREKSLLEFAVKGLGHVQEHVAGELLGDGAAALDKVQVLQVVEVHAEEPDDVNAPVVVEALVLDRDHRDLEGVRDFVQRHRLAPFLGEVTDQLALAVEQLGGNHRPVVLEFGGLGQAVLQAHKSPGQDAHQECESPGKSRDKDAAVRVQHRQ